MMMMTGRKRRTDWPRAPERPPREVAVASSLVTAGMRVHERRTFPGEVDGGPTVPLPVPAIHPPSTAMKRKCPSGF
jgi:hypothetical protein